MLYGAGAALVGMVSSAYVLGTCVGVEFSMGILTICIQLDKSGLAFFALLTFIASTCAGLSLSYVYQKSAPRRLYFTFYWLFYLCMVGLIFSGDLMSLFLFWDGLGITSFFLVGLFSGSGPRSGALLTLLSNRAGDVFLIVGSAGLWASGGLVYSTWSATVGWAGGFVFFGLLCKSAQWPVSGWLPAAMSAPTPVSALVHSSTLVTAGLYIAIRLGPGLLTWSFVWLGIGLCTFLLGGASAMLSYDIKRIVAMSTLSHLGLMAATLSAGYSSTTFFHLLVHALFKSNAFLSAGNLITSAKHTQDLRLMGAPLVFAPLSTMSLLASVWSLGGLPSALSYFSKGFCVMGGHSSGFSLLLLGGVLMGVAYTSRLTLALLADVTPSPHPVGGLLLPGVEYPVFFSTLLGIAGTLVSGSMATAPSASFGWEAAIISGGLGAVGSLCCGSCRSRGGSTGVYHIGSILCLHRAGRANSILVRHWEQRAGPELFGRGAWGSVRGLGVWFSGLKWL